MWIKNETSAQSGLSSLGLKMLYDLWQINSDLSHIRVLHIVSYLYSWKKIYFFTRCKEELASDNKQDGYTIKNLFSMSEIVLDLLKVPEIHHFNSLFLISAPCLSTWLMQHRATKSKPRQQQMNERTGIKIANRAANIQRFLHAAQFGTRLSRITVQKFIYRRWFEELFITVEKKEKKQLN